MYGLIWLNLQTRPLCWYRASSIIDTVVKPGYDATYREAASLVYHRTDGSGLSSVVIFSVFRELNFTLSMWLVLCHCVLSRLRWSAVFCRDAFMSRIDCHLYIKSTCLCNVFPISTLALCFICVIVVELFFSCNLFIRQCRNLLRLGTCESQISVWIESRIESAAMIRIESVDSRLQLQC